jgi:hypothetical protein
MVQTGVHQAIVLVVKGNVLETLLDVVPNRPVLLAHETMNLSDNNADVTVSLGLVRVELGVFQSSRVFQSRRVRARNDLVELALGRQCFFTVIMYTRKLLDRFQLTVLYSWAIEKVLYRCGSLWLRGRVEYPSRSVGNYIASRCRLINPPGATNNSLI